jgi:hypothetical protein
VHDGTFDRVTRAVDRLASRRTTLRGLVGVGLAALGNAGLQAAAKKKTCKKPNTKCGEKGCCKAGSQLCLEGRCVAACQFTTNKKTKTMTLKANCTLTKPIIIPDGFTLDGNGKTITLAGSLRNFSLGGFSGAAIANAKGVGDGAVRRLTIDAAPASAVCDAPMTAIAVSAKRGEIEDVTIQNTNCFPGISAGGKASSSVRITNTTVKNAVLSDSGAIVLRGPLEAVIANCTFQDISDGDGIAMVTEAVTATISESNFTNVKFGIENLVPGEVNVTNNQMQVVTFGVHALSGTVNVTNNAITGRGADGGNRAAGVSFFFGATGSVAGNVISNFSSADACGILLAVDASKDVTIGANDFSVPPPNETDVCDFRPL